jgi:hypothetical protein
MTMLLDKAIKVLRQLPPEEQDELAREVLDRIAADRRWEALLGDPRSGPLLDRLSREAREEIAAGRVVDGDPSDRVGD